MGCLRYLLVAVVTAAASAPLWVARTSSQPAAPVAAAPRARAPPPPPTFPAPRDPGPLTTAAGDVVTLEVPPEFGPNVTALAWSPGARVALVHVPKTGGTFAEAAFKHLLELETGALLGARIFAVSRFKAGVMPPWRRTGQGPAAVVDGGFCSPWHTPLTRVTRFAAGQRMPLHALSPYYSRDVLVASVRHPYDRFVSEYMYSIGGNWFGWQMFDLGLTSLSSQFFRGRVAEYAQYCDAGLMNEFAVNVVKLMTRERDAAAAGGGMPAHPFMADCHLVPQWEYVYGVDGRQRVRHVLRTERLNADLSAFVRAVGAGVTDAAFEAFRERKRAEKGGFHKVEGCKLAVGDLNATAREHLHRYYRADFDLFGYTP